MRKLILAILLFMPFSGQAQEIDSLVLRYAQEENYDNQLKILSDLVKTTLWNDPDTASYFAQEFKRVAIENNDTLETGRGLNFEGMIYYFSGTYDKAIAKYLEAYPYFEMVGDEYMVGMMYNNIGAAYTNRFDPERTIEFYEKALTTFEAINDTTWILNLKHNLANEYFNQGDVERAQLNYTKALEGFTEVQDTAYMSYATNGLGTCNFAQKNYEEALRLYRRAELLADSTIDLSFFGSLNTNICKSLIALESFEEAEDRGLNGLSIAQRLNEKHRMFSAHDNLSSLYSKTGRFEEALYHSEMKFNWNDSIFAGERERASAEMIAKFETDQVENDLAIKELELLKEQRQGDYFIGGLVFLALLLLGAGFLIFINKRNTHKLEEKNAQIQLALEEKELLLREIHHRVKNNLQVVSSLLGIQSRHIDDKVAHEAITASRSRVLSMSLIHQNLYTQESLTNIHIRNYVSDLCSSIMSTYSRSSQITLHTEVDETQIDVDTLIPLGLIMNELINNSLKHAFEEEQTGNLWVKLVETQGGLVLEIKDDGVGFNLEDHQGKGSFGMKMLDAFAKKLRAKWTIKGDNGTTFTMWVDKNKVA